MEHAFNTNIAAQYDVNIAVLLHLFKQFSNCPPLSDWFEATPACLDNFLFFWSRKKTTFLVNKLIKLNLLKRQENKPFFYSLTPYALSLYQDQGRII